MRNKEQKYILLVEDNQSDEELTLRALAKYQIANTVIIVRDGAQALEFLFAKGEFSHRDPRDLPQVVLLDLKLPKVDGIDVLKQVRKNEVTRHLPVVILTSSREESDIARGYESGANSFVTKPVEFGEFSEAIRNLSLYWYILNDPHPGMGVLKE